MPAPESNAWPWLRDRLLRLRMGPGAAALPAVAPAVRTAVVTDSAAALPADWVRALAGDGRLGVVSMPVMVGTEIYGEGEADLAETIALALASGKQVRTSRPSPGQFERAYTAAMDHGFEAVVSVHLSGELSGTVDSARLAADRAGIPVHVVDSRTVGMAQGMGVQAALAAAGRGGGGADVVASARAQLDRACVYFYVPSLEQLRRGGRIGAAASLWGSMFSIKPILAVEAGKVVPLEKVRTAARAITRLEEIVLADAARRPPGRARLAVHHFGNRSEAEELAGRLAAALPASPPAQISALPAVLAAHAGLGVLAVIVGEEPGAQAPGTVPASRDDYGTKV